MDLMVSIWSQNSSFYCCFAYMNLTFSLLPFSMNHCFLSLTYILEVGNLVTCSHYVFRNFQEFIFWVSVVLCCLWYYLYCSILSLFREGIEHFVAPVYLSINYCVEDPRLITCPQLLHAKGKCIYGKLIIWVGPIKFWHMKLLSPPIPITIEFIRIVGLFRALYY